MIKVKRSTFYYLLFFYVCTLCFVSLCIVVWWVWVPFYKMGTGLRMYIHTYVGESGQCRHMGINWKPSPGQGGVGSRPEEVWARATEPFHQCRHVLQVGHRQRVAGDALPESSRQEQGGTHFYFKIFKHVTQNGSQTLWSNVHCTYFLLLPVLIVRWTIYGGLLSNGLLNDTHWLILDVLCVNWQLSREIRRRLENSISLCVG